ncbi:MAG: radical SAM family heme chaperone HemW [Candidatus Schekmanbacteria bacterium]|nr:radical SAM family heme chaperone HemW [Candidatus Schekmanbacteria bacterium]
MSPQVGLYVHIPFCRSKCLYCGFSSVATANPAWRDYLAAVLRELASYAEHPFSADTVTSIYVGGGTPSMLPPPFYAELFARVSARFAIAADCETTLEANPTELPVTWLRAFRAAGFNRVSFGVQSLAAERLRRLGRNHTPDDARKSVSEAREAGFSEVSIDLMFGLPGQTVAGWRAELEEAILLPITHLSAYALTVEQGTPLARLVRSGTQVPAGEEDCAQMFLLTRQILRERGFLAYELANFARPTPCRHNQRYWRRESYLGLGAAAHSFCADGFGPPGAEGSVGAGGCRWWNAASAIEYQQEVSHERRPAHRLEWLSAEEAVEELLLTALRTDAGVTLQEIKRTASGSVSPAFRAACDALRRGGLLAVDTDRLRLSDQGALLADTVILELAGAVSGRQGAVTGR